MSEPTRKDRPGDSQDLPTPNDEPDIQSLVIADIRARRQIGVERYGTPLQPHNGRSALVDLYEELIDAACYAKQRIVEDGTEPEFTLDARGFKSMAEVPSEYGGVVRTRESSAAEGPHIWVVLNDIPVDFNDPGGPTKDAHAHLTWENAKKLRDQLAWLIDNHYQVQ